MLSGLLRICLTVLPFAVQPNSNSGTENKYWLTPAKPIRWIWGNDKMYVQRGMHGIQIRLIMIPELIAMRAISCLSSYVQRFNVLPALLLYALNYKHEGLRLTKGFLWLDCFDKTNLIIMIKKKNAILWSHNTRFSSAVSLSLYSRLASVMKGKPAWKYEIIIISGVH